MRVLSVPIALALLAAAPAVAPAASFTLVEKGSPRACIVVPDAALAEKPGEDGRLWRDAAEDLRHYVEQISGAVLAISNAPVGGLAPIHVGTAGLSIPTNAASEFGDAYVIDVSAARVALQGESPRATYYAAAQVLQQLGVSWYAPGPLGEVVPKSDTLRLPTGRIVEAPRFATRHLWGGTPEEQRWLLRNRLGGPALAQGHAFARYMKQASLEEHPDYYPVVGGKPVRTQANLSNPAVAKLMADQIAAAFRAGPTAWAGGKSACIGPDDGFLLDERPESRAMDSGEMDPLYRVPSATDRFLAFANEVCRLLRPEFPDHTLGFYIYSNHCMPPRRVKPDPMLVPLVAPIAFSRYLPVGSPREPTAMLLESVIRDWAALCPRLGCYLYNFNLADTAMPFTRSRAWSEGLPRLYELGVRSCTIESMPNWHTMVPGNWIAANLLWDPSADVKALREEFYPRYYGPAGIAMRQYDATLETAYDTEAYAGNLWSMHRILAPDVMAALESDLAAAAEAVQGDPAFAPRVEIARFSLNFAADWLAARAALNAGELTNAAACARAFVTNYEAASRKFPLFFGPSIRKYFEAFHLRAFEDADRVATNGVPILQFPDEWAAFLDEDRIGARMGLHRPEAGTGNWTRLRTYSASLDEQGFPFFRGLIWYRQEFSVPEEHRRAPACRLWFGGLDATAHVWLNGRDLGEHAVANFGPLDLDVTAALAREGRNVLVVAVDNTPFNELGTGGIVRPVRLYAAGGAP